MSGNAGSLLHGEALEDRAGSHGVAQSDQVMRLTASTDGTGAGTDQAELYSTQKRFLDGTYASRIRFTDAPVSGADGDHINETFFTISPLNGDLDPTYSELDISEYLPNGGWGETGPINYQTSWYAYRNDPWYADNVHSEERKSFDGWHDLVVQVANGHMIYSAVYTGGNLVKHEKSRNGDPGGPPSGQGKHLWKARYWTQGSEPGWTEQWQDLGRC
ncbi:hypothetical protein [Actinoplanes sp. NPDC026619]|uniref:hypothetical protein n=1 Tax=Actinoplanes sp. NPDC026619 TaxID=3155798 RepID=UPI0033FC1218